MSMIAAAAQSTGADMDFAVYLLMRVAHIMSQHLAANLDQPGTFEMALYALAHPPPSAGANGERDASLN
jgi:hypothetical protein